MKKIKFKIDGNEIEGIKDHNILDIAKENGIHIPSLCYHQEVHSSGGSCRVCLVEVHQGGKMRVVTSCNYPVRDDIEVKTSTPLIKRLRSNIIELLLSRTPDSEVIKELAQNEGITETRFRKDEGEAYRNKCIACQLCVQVCEEVVGVSAISMLNRGQDKSPNTPYKKPSETCIGCGACAYVCPTQCIPMTTDGNIRKIWNKEFKMHTCKECGVPFIPEFQIEWIVKTKGVDKSFFDKCNDCR